VNALDAFCNIPEMTKTAVIATIISVVVFFSFVLCINVFSPLKNVAGS